METDSSAARKNYSMRVLAITEDGMVVLCIYFIVVAVSAISGYNEYF